MPDVPDRCPMCGAPERRQLLVGNYYAESNAIEYECDTMVIEGGETSETSESPNCLRRQRDAARAEAERWKRRHDALRAVVIKADALIVDAINRATAMYNYTQDADYESRADGLDEALMILRQLLAKAGGGDQ